MTEIEEVRNEVADLRARFDLLVELLRSLPSAEGLPVLGEHRGTRYRRILTSRSESLDQ